MALFKNPRGSFVFPVELVHAVVEEVSTQTVIDPQLHANTLCALSCVCQAFYFAARGQLLSAITFRLFLDRQSTQKRAAALIHVLEKEPTLLQNIRSMTLIVLKDPTVPFERLSELQENRHLPTKLLNLTLQSQSLRKLSIEGYISELNSYYLHWNQLNLHEKPAIVREIYTNSALQSLKIVNVHQIPWQLLLSNSDRSILWQELTLINTEFDNPIKFRRSWENDTDFDVISQFAGSVGVMTLLGFQHDFLDTLQSFFDTVAVHFKSSPIYFKRLHTLRITMPRSNHSVNSLQYFLMEAAETLETIELRLHPRFRTSELLGIYPLNKLKSLKNLRICVEINDGGCVDEGLPERISQYLGLASQVLLSAASSSSLASIHIGVLVEITDKRVASVIGPTPYLDIQQLKWEVLDEQIDQPGAFMGLRYISLQIDKYQSSKHFDATHCRDEDSKIHLSTLFPCTCARSSLQGADLKLRSIYSFERMDFLVNNSF